MELTSKQKYNRSEKGKKKNAEYARKRRADPKYREEKLYFGWKRRGLKYYPDNLFLEYEKKQKCHYCNKELKKNIMEHNHITGSFRGFTCQSCNIKVAWTDKYFKMCMNELNFINNKPSVYNIFIKNNNM